jgi:hypothetical protein
MTVKSRRMSSVGQEPSRFNGMILKWTLKIYGFRMPTTFMLLMTETIGGLLLSTVKNFMRYKIRRIISFSRNTNAPWCWLK